MKKTISIVLVLAFGLASTSLTAEDTWTHKADMPTARSCLSTSVVNGKIYAIGGTAGFDQGVGGDVPLSTVEEYDTGFAIEAKGKLATTWGIIRNP